MHTFLTPEPITIEIRNSAGDVTVELTDTSTTTVDLAVSDGHPLHFLGNGVIDDMMKAVDRWRGGDQAPATDGGDTVQTDQLELVNVQLRDTVLIVDTDPARNGMFSAFTVRISAPAGSSLRAKTQSSDVGVSGRADRLEIRTASGDITVNRADGAVVAQTSSGDVEIASVGGDLDLRAVSGSVELGEVTGSLHAQTTSGDLVVLAPGGDVKVRSVSGDVEVRGASTGSTEITTVSGDTLVSVRPGAVAHLKASSTTGSASSDLEVQDASPSADTDHPFDLRVRCDSTTGNIRIVSAQPAH